MKRVVITSATPAINGPDETHWNDASVEAVKRDGINTHPRVKYWASKTLAERAAWKFMKDNKGKINFELTTLCPPWVCPRFPSHFPDIYLHVLYCLLPLLVDLGCESPKTVTGE